ncbi:MAG: acyl transferase [Flavobacterium sp. BFFFF2]|nr:MAG: acyl transferase [Flavobacterium sp. BFFFF2]
MELPFTPDQLFFELTPKKFGKWALKAFRYQYAENKVYQEFCDLLGKTPANVDQLKDIPFLPISFFKTHQVISGPGNPTHLFTSSGTTGSQASSHLVLAIDWYESSFLQAFSLFYGNIEDYVVLALLPSYLEREGSSLIYMTERLIAESKQAESGFYLFEHDELIETIQRLESEGRQILLIGVTYALLDLLEKGPFQWKNTLIMETGGMKGKRKEMVREELHDILKAGFGVSSIHSEYGMTELLSQAYSLGEGVFECPPWMQILIREPEDPFHYLPFDKQGGINVIDLANIHSCCFIATQDLGKMDQTGRFEVLGRFDHADLRGCNLMIPQ